ncbi:MAG: hypothetical protein JWN22_1281 [Nocardioides sp.]|jgi:hypothetical protein|nr:hypothetical protein [Nocardioides sp.]
MPGDSLQRRRQHGRELDGRVDLVGGAWTVGVELVAGALQPDGRYPGLERAADVAAEVATCTRGPSSATARRYIAACGL